MNKHYASQAEHASSLRDEIVEVVAVNCHDLKTVGDQRHYETLTAILTTRDGNSHAIANRKPDPAMAPDQPDEQLVKSSVTYGSRSVSPNGKQPLSTFISSNKVVNYEETILNALHFRGISQRRNAIPKSYSQTFEWIWSDCPGEVKWDPFGKWLERDDEFCYWISGKAGSGKSALMKYIQDDPRLSIFLSTWAGPSDIVISSFYFWYAGMPLQRSLDGLLRGLLFDVLSRRREMVAVGFPDICRAILSQSLDGPLEISHEELKAAFLSFTKNIPRDLKLCFMVDGVDEYSGDYNEICDLFLEVTKSHSIKAILSSRPIPACVYRFDDAPKLRLQDLTYKDIQRYVWDKLGQHPLMNRMERANQGVTSRLVDMITTRANGVFLWVVLVTKTIDRGLQNYYTWPDLMEELEKLPPDLEKLYDHMLGAMSERDRLVGSKFLQLVLRNFEISCSYPMTLLQLSFVVEDDDYEKCLQAPTKALTAEQLNWRCEATEGRLRSRCCGLIEVQNPGDDLMRSKGEHTIGFLHRTVVEFLQADIVWPKITSKTCDTKFNADLALMSSSVYELKASKPTRPAEFRSPSSSLTRMARFLSYEKNIECRETMIALHRKFYPEMRKALGYHWHDPTLFDSPLQEFEAITQSCTHGSNRMGLSFAKSAILSLGIQPTDPNLYHALQEGLELSDGMTSELARLLLHFIGERDARLRFSMSRAFQFPRVQLNTPVSFEGHMSKLWDYRWKNAVHAVNTTWTIWEFLLHYCFSVVTHTEDAHFDFTNSTGVNSFLHLVSICARVGKVTSITVVLKESSTFKKYREISSLAVLNQFLQQVWSKIRRESATYVDEIAELAASIEQALNDGGASTFDQIHTYQKPESVREVMISRVRRIARKHGESSPKTPTLDIKLDTVPFPSASQSPASSPWIQHRARSQSRQPAASGAAKKPSARPAAPKPFWQRQWQLTPRARRIELLNSDEQQLVADLAKDGQTPREKRRLHGILSGKPYDRQREILECVETLKNTTLK